MDQMFQPSWAAQNFILAAHIEWVQVSLIFTSSSGVETVLANLTTPPLAVCEFFGQERWQVQQTSPASASIPARTLSLFAEACVDTWLSTCPREREGILKTVEGVTGFLVPIRSFPD